MLRAPFSKIMPMFATITLERGLPGYETDTLIPGERRLTKPKWDRCLSPLSSSESRRTRSIRLKKDASKKKLTTKDVEHFLEKKDLTTSEPRLVTPRVQLRQ